MLSFYKEDIVGEKSYIHDRAAATSTSVAQALAGTVDDIVASVARARSILQGEKEWVAFETFMRGYIFFHFVTPRYLLKDTIGRRWL